MSDLTASNVWLRGEIKFEQNEETLNIKIRMGPKTSKTELRMRYIYISNDLKNWLNVCLQNSKLCVTQVNTLIAIWSIRIEYTFSKNVHNKVARYIAEKTERHWKGKRNELSFVVGLFFGTETAPKNLPKFAQCNDQYSMWSIIETKETWTERKIITTFKNLHANTCEAYSFWGLTHRTMH